MKPFTLFCVSAVVYMIYIGATPIGTEHYGLLAFLPVAVWAAVNRVQRLRDNTNLTDYIKPMEEGRVGNVGPTDVVVTRGRGIVGLLADILLLVGLVGTAVDKQMAYVTASGILLHVVNFSVSHPT